jgi:patatin-like phospholipase/acyl hydrolase
MKVVAFTGGGCFGYAQALTMCAVDPRILSSIDCFAGTSIGAILALGYGLNLPPATLARFFIERSERIFAGRWWRRRARAVLHPRYPDTELNNALQDLFDGATCADLRRPCVVCSHDLGAGRPRTWWTPAHLDLPLWELARMSAAAHTYFRRWKMQRDGGVFHNDPSMAALMALIRVHGCTLHATDLFALGNGRNPTHRTEHNHDEPGLVTGILGELVNDLLDGAAVVANREDANNLLRVYGGRFESFEFPSTCMDMDDPAVLDMIRYKWAGETREAAYAIDTFFSPAPANQDILP